ncbi:MAG: hypothetical protein PHP75_01970 [Methylacidiphilaceae bacterium]|nr:hypothetical protein [Candidatus Methylacidiphilaceae bacterium]
MKADLVDVSGQEDLGRSLRMEDGQGVAVSVGLDPVRLGLHIIDPGTLRDALLARGTGRLDQGP